MQPHTLCTGSVLPTAWSLSSSVRIIPPGQGSQIQTAFFTNPSAHFHDQHGVNFAGSTVSTQYDFEIMESLAEYNIQTQLNCVSVDGSRPDCKAAGTLNITPRIDVWVQASGSYAYSLPTDPSTADASFRVFSYASSTFLFSSGGADDSILSGPHSGVFNINTGGLISAGTPIQISYVFRTTFFTGAANVAAASSGDLHFTMTPVPEPAALGLLTLAALAIRGRRRPQLKRRPAGG